MVRVCCESEVIQCEEPATNALHLEENQAVLVLLDHCKATRRQEYLSRVALAFLLLSSLAFFFFFRITPQPVDTTQEYGFAHRRQQRVKPYAHLTVLSPRDSKPEYEPDTHKILAWEMNNGLAHTDSNGFRYDQKKQALVILSTGFYNVYLQITYKKPETVECDHRKSPILLTARVGASIDGYNSTIMTVYESLPCSGQILKSVFTSGIYKLEKNAELRVNVNRFDLVDRYSEMKTYFGAFLFEAVK